MSQKYFLITYGCQMNKSDSERIAAVLEKIGYQKASKENEADLILVNMCSVRQSAVDRIFGQCQKFVKLKTLNPKLKTILTGCVLKEDKKKFQKWFDLILNIKDLPNWPQKIASVKPTHKISDRLFCESGYFTIQSKYQSNFSAFIPISNGCNNSCSYCVIPFTRGRLVCRDHGEVLNEAKSAVQGGFKEIWLLGQNVNSYYSPIRANTSIISFPKLLKMVNDIEGNFWIRFTSPHPKDFSDELIETMAKCEKVTPYLNLPVQSGDDEVLRRMNRPYKISEYKNLIEKIRDAFKKYRKGLEREIALSTDIIVGFPGETERQFENTVKFFKEIKYDMAYIAKYSPRSGTVAAKLKDDVPAEKKERRYKILTGILKETALEKNKKYIGKKVEVLIDSSKNSFYFGKTRTYKTVKIQTSDFRLQTSNLVGQFVKVKIIDALPLGLKGILS